MDDKSIDALLPDGTTATFPNILRYTATCLDEENDVWQAAAAKQMRKAASDHEAALAQIEELKADVAEWREHENAAVERGRRYQIELAAAKRDAENWREAMRLIRSIDPVAFDAARTPSAAQGGEKP